MDDRGASNNRDRRPGGRESERSSGGRESERSSGGHESERSSARRGYLLPRAQHRHPVYGSQAHRGNRQWPYIIGYVLVVGVLAAFLYFGLNWATGPGRVSALANPPTPTPIAVVAPTSPPPSPTVGEQTYVVRAGDNPATIATQFHIKTDELIAANNIDDPQKLQIGQTLKIPPPSSGR